MMALTPRQRRIIQNVGRFGTPTTPIVVRKTHTSPLPAQSPLQAAADARTRFVVVLEGAAGADTAHARTLRYLLKYLLRSRSLRCTEVRQVDRDDDGGER
jgi:hypothetical protein